MYKLRRVSPLIGSGRLLDRNKSERMSIWLNSGVFLSLDWKRHQQHSITLVVLTEGQKSFGDCVSACVCVCVCVCVWWRDKDAMESEHLCVCVCVCAGGGVCLSKTFNDVRLSVCVCYGEKEQTVCRCVFSPVSQYAIYLCLFISSYYFFKHFKHLTVMRSKAKGQHSSRHSGEEYKEQTQSNAPKFVTDA